MDAVDHAAGVMRAIIGASAGVPLAGVLAVVGLSKVSRRIRGRLALAVYVMQLDHEAAQATLDPNGMLNWEHAGPVSNVGIVDDDVYLYDCSPDEAVSAASTIATIVFEEHQRAGLELHLKPTKTVVMFS